MEDNYYIELDWRGVVWFTEILKNHQHICKTRFKYTPKTMTQILIKLTIIDVQDPASIGARKMVNTRNIQQKSLWKLLGNSKCHKLSYSKYISKYIRLYSSLPQWIKHAIGTSAYGDVSRLDQNTNMTQLTVLAFGR